jgi:tetratricopeptide (TPR) repeat protein/tRNA A-37 threonylcarbamoyl transferase component Bud32/TolB-like protein
MIGRIVSHFRILEKIDAGGMGVIYRAMDRNLKRHVALKVLRPDLVADRERRARFLREARAAAAMTHPNIATIYEVGEVDGNIFIAMELIDGDSLHQILQRDERPEVPEILDIAIQITEGMTEAHSRRIVHLDLKPDNVMVTTRGGVRILDFGLARPLRPPDPAEMSGDDRETVSLDRIDDTRIAGTVHYMSPEQVMGKPLDERSDLFSFGTMLYEMLTGRRPFDGENVTATFARILETEPAPILEIRPGLPAGLDPIIRRCLQKDPGSRYATTVALVDDLRRVRRALLPGGEWTGAPIAGAASPDISPTRIAVFPFAVRGSNELAYLREGLVDILSTKLDGAGELRCVDPHAILCCEARGLGPSPDPIRVADMARRFGAGLFIMGTIVELGGRLQLEAALYDATTEPAPVTRATVQGETTRIFELIDNLTTELLAGRCGGPETRLTQIAAMTTGSFPALKAYLEGEREMRAMRRGPAMDAFRRAVDADPDFALTWYRLSVAALWFGQPGVARDAIRRAGDLSDRLGDRDRDLVRAFAAVVRGANNEAERLYRVYVGNHPEDLEAWYQLAELQFHFGPLRGRPLADSSEAWERVLQLDPGHINAMVHLGAIGASRGDRDAVEAMAQRALDLGQRGDSAVWMLALRAFAVGNEAERDEVIGRLRKADDLSVNLTLIFIGAYLADIASASRLAGILTEPVRSDLVRARGYLILAHLDLARGRWSAARAHLDAAAGLRPRMATEYRALLSAAPFLQVPADDLGAIRGELGRLSINPPPETETSRTWSNPHQGLHGQLCAYLQGLMCIGLGESQKALDFADRLEELGDLADSGHLVRDLAVNLRGHAAAGRKNPEQALALLEKARMECRFDQSFLSPFFSQAHERFARAELLRRLGRECEAIAWYGSFAENSLYDLVYLAPAQRRLGDIYHRLGDSDRATEHTRRFLELWDDCDPELRPQVQEARIFLSNRS